METFLIIFEIFELKDAILIYSVAVNSYGVSKNSVNYSICQTICWMRYYIVFWRSFYIVSIFSSRR